MQSGPIGLMSKILIKKKNENKKDVKVKIFPVTVP